MSDNCKIEWLDWPGYKSASCNCVKGCTRVSEGCRHCYAERMAARFSKPGQWGHGIAEMRGSEPRWTGVVELDEAKLLLPLTWRAPRCIFVNSTSDLFHERLPDDAIYRVFAVMALCPQHRFIVLTKRAERMRRYFERCAKLIKTRLGTFCQKVVWPLPNVVVGVSIEDQSTADERIPHLLATPAACRMVSAEPLLGPVDLPKLGGLSWVVTGGESGPGARPAHPEWFMSIRDQCSAAGVAYFHKQNGGSNKKSAGRLLDGREHNEFPE